MSNLRKKQNPAAPKKDNCEENPRSNLIRSPNVPRSKFGYSIQVSEEIEEIEGNEETVSGVQ